MVDTMVDAMDPDRLDLVIDAAEKPVGTASGTVIASQFAPERLADAARFAYQVAEGELDDRREDPRRQLVQVTLANGGESGRVVAIGVGHLARPPRYLILGSDLILTVGPASGDISLGLLHRLCQARLRQPVQDLLNGFPSRIDRRAAASSRSSGSMSWRVPRNCL